MVMFADGVVLLAFQVKLIIPQDAEDSGGPKRCGTFVMYNCARLAMLFSRFNQAVKKGTLFLILVYPYPEYVKHHISLACSSQVKYHLLRNHGQHICR